MKPRLFRKPATALAVMLALLAIPATAQTHQISVSLDTRLLVGAAGPFYVGFQLADGSLEGNGSNGVFVNNIQFGGGSAVPPVTPYSTALGDLSSAVTLTDLSVFSVMSEAFNPGATLSFNVSYTSNLDTSIPDEFVMVILDHNFSPLPTTGGVALLQIDFDSASPTIQTFSGNASVSGGIAIPAPVVTQAATLRSISVTPANPSVTKGLTQQFTATGTFSDNSTQNLTGSVTWTSSPSSVATIVAGGLATGAGVGTSTISASSGGVTGSTVLTVTAATLQSIAVTPANPSIPKSATQQFTATGLFSDNSTQDFTKSAIWTSANTSVATIAAGGLATGLGAGTSMISATAGTMSNATILTVGAVVAMPNVVGENENQALSAIANAGLQAVSLSQTSSTVPAGDVISESPLAGTLLTVGSQVIIVSSGGPPQVPVPNVVGTTQTAATTAITSAGLVVGTVTQQASSTVASGTVISQSPAPATQVNPGSAVNIVVSTGPGQVAVPNVVGLTQAAATAAIANAGLVVASATQAYTNLGYYSGPQNMVLQGVPGTTQNLIINIAGFPAGWDCLQLTISSTGTASVGSNPISSTAGFAVGGSTPNYSEALSLNLGDPYAGAYVANPVILWGNGITGGFSDGEAYAPILSGTESQGPYYAGWIHFKLQNSALPTATLTVIDWAYGVGNYPLPMGQLPVRDVPTGNIVSESPTGGTVVAAGSGVNLNVSEGPLPEGVPNVVGLTQTAGTNQIITGGLLVGTVTQQSSATVPSGSIISESPAAYTSLPIDSSVNLVVSTGPAQVSVPNVVGSTQTAATGAITGAGLALGTVTQQSSSTVPTGSVVSESPVAGTSVNVGSAVNLVVSTGPAMVAVPNAVGSTQAAATSAITGAGLVVGTVTQQSSSTIVAGSVISESPVSGTLVTVGSAVNLVVSSGPAQSGPPPSFVQVNQNEISSGSSVAVRLNAATKAGNTIVVYAIWDNAGSASVKDSQSDSFAGVSPAVTWGNGYSAQIFYATNIAGGTDTVTLAFKQAVSTFGVVYAHEYSGINTSNPIDVIASANGSSATLNSTFATTTSANDLIFGAGVSDNNVSGAGSGFTARDLTYGNITEDKIAVSIGSYAATATHDGQQWGMQMVAFRAAGTSGSGGGVVASPTFNPPAGTYPSAQSVKLTTATAGASIYYTTDGSAPSTLSTLYTVPISVNSSLTIKAIAHEAGMTDSPIVSAAYQIGAAGTPPAFVQANDNDISAGSSVPVSFNNPVKAGDTIVVYAIWDNAGSASITDTLGNHFVSVSAPVSWGNGYSAQIFYATNLAAGADTVKAAFATPATIFGVIYAHEYSGISASNPLDVIASASGSSATLNSGVATTTSANDLIFGAGVSDNNVTKAGTGFTARDLDYGNITEDKTAASIGSYSATATHNGQQWGMQMVAFRPAQ
jgi:beta-lactam-binding protein with PASTA domain